MARIRTIKPSFFRHEALFEAEKGEGLPLRVAFAGLWTAADREGRFVWKPRELKLDCLPHDELDFSRVLDALATRGFIVKYVVTEKTYGFIPSWQEHQVINNRESASRIPAPNETNILTCGPRVPNACTTPLVQDQGEGKGKGREGKGTDTDAVASATSGMLASNLFVQFWEVYPKRDGANPMEPARKKFLALVRSGISADAIISGAKVYGNDLRTKSHIDSRYVVQAIKWLDESRWQDYAPKPGDAANLGARNLPARAYNSSSFAC